jgi:hypothetical protein
MLLLAAMSIALVQAAMTHVRIIDGVETIVSHRMANMSSIATKASNESVSVPKRWDGSPAYQEYQTAYNRGCTLNGMLNLDDARAGQLFTPPRASAHSDLLDVQGKI